MLKVENTVTPSGEQWTAVIRGMRNPMNSWDKSDSGWVELDDAKKADTGETFRYLIEEADHELMIKLSQAGSDHAKFRRMIPVYADIVAPLYWWKEFDTYKVGTVANSCSTMHKIHAKEFTLDDFSHEHLTFFEHDGELCRDWLGDLEDLIDDLNFARGLYLLHKDKRYWWQMIQLLPSSYNQRRTVMLNYEVLANIYHSRKDHRLDEWHTLCDWIEKLPYSEIIIGESEGNKNV